MQSPEIEIITKLIEVNKVFIGCNPFITNVATTSKNS
jgi:hypothetical protein